MNIVSRVSDITPKELGEYLRLDEMDEADELMLTNLLNVAVSFIKNYTGREEIDELNDLVIVAQILVQDMWDNRALYIDEENMNQTVRTILNLHCVNFIPTEDES